MSANLTEQNKKDLNDKSNTTTTAATAAATSETMARVPAATVLTIKKVAGNPNIQLSDNLEFLVCNICTSEPRRGGFSTLPCGHYLCMGCIEAQSNHYQKEELPCPECREPYNTVAQKPTLALKNLIQSIKVGLSTGSMLKEVSALERRFADADKATKEQKKGQEREATLEEQQTRNKLNEAIEQQRILNEIKARQRDALKERLREKEAEVERLKREKKKLKDELECKNKKHRPATAATAKTKKERKLEELRSINKKLRERKDLAKQRELEDLRSKNKALREREDIAKQKLEKIRLQQNSNPSELNSENPSNAASSTPKAPSTIDGHVPMPRAAGNTAASTQPIAIAEPRSNSDFAAKMTFVKNFMEKFKEFVESERIEDHEWEAGVSVSLPGTLKDSIMLDSGMLNIFKTGKGIIKDKKLAIKLLYKDLLLMCKNHDFDHFNFKATRITITSFNPVQMQFKFRSLYKKTAIDTTSTRSDSAADASSGAQNVNDTVGSMIQDFFETFKRKRSPAILNNDWAEMIAYQQADLNNVEDSIRQVTLKLQTNATSEGRRLLDQLLDTKATLRKQIAKYQAKIDEEKAKSRISQNAAGSQSTFFDISHLASISPLKYHKIIPFSRSQRCTFCNQLAKRLKEITELEWQHGVRLVFTPYGGDGVKIDTEISQYLVEVLNNLYMGSKNVLQEGWEMPYPSPNHLFLSTSKPNKQENDQTTCIDPEKVTVIVIKNYSGPDIDIEFQIRPFAANMPISIIATAAQSAGSMLGNTATTLLLSSAASAAATSATSTTPTEQSALSSISSRSATCTTVSATAHPK